MAPAEALSAAEEAAESEIAIRPSGEEANGDCPETSTAADLMCANNCEDNAFYGEASCEQRKVDDAQDREIDVLGCEGGGALELMKDQDPDATEHSSSFGDTFSGSGDGCKADPGDTEVDSKFYVENGDSSGLDGDDRVFKKKRVTDHWRRFIRPLMWRCQWLELRMKELHSEASTYDKELEAYKHEKLLRTKVVELSDSASRSVPLTCRIHRNRALRRQKRKRNEDTVDISSYMSRHHIFSYYENKRPETDCHSVDDGGDDQVGENINDDLEWSLFRFRRRRDSSLEQILADIESVMSRVQKLKHHLNEATPGNSREIPSALANSIIGHLSTSGAQSHSFSAGNNGDAMQVDAPNTPTRHISECEMEDRPMPGSEVSSYGDAADLHMIESTLGLFITDDINVDEDEIANLCEDIGGAVLISNLVAEEELQDFEKVSHAMDKPQEAATDKAQAVAHEEVGPSNPKESSSAPMSSKPELCPGAEKVDVPQQPALKPCYTGKRRGRKPKKRRRGGLAAGSGGATNSRVQKQ